MPSIAFIGLGNMGMGMARNLVSAGYKVRVFDLVSEQMQALAGLGATAANSAADAVVGAELVISMLPASAHVQSLYFDKQHGIAAHAAKNTLFIDCSTIEAKAAKHFNQQLLELGHRFVDAPVSGGVAGANAGTLTFIVGGEEANFVEAQKVLLNMGKNIFHAGEVGSGQVAKICNNMLLAVLMAGTSEALNLAIKNGLDPKVMSDIMLQSSGRNWTLELYNPCPDVMPNVPSSHQYQGGFMTQLMNKDLGLAMDTAGDVKANVPLGELAQKLYLQHAQAGNEKLDFSSVFNYFR